MTERNSPHMPLDHNVLMGEIRALLREDETLMKDVFDIAMWTAMLDDAENRDQAPSDSSVSWGKSTC